MKKTLHDEEYEFGHYDDIDYKNTITNGLSVETVKMISASKNEPEWMLELRIKAFNKFMEMDMPEWGPDLSEIDFNKVNYYVKATDKTVAQDWDNVDDKIKATFEAIGIPEAEQKFLSGVTAQYDSEVVYHNTKNEWADLGVYFTDTDTALREKPELFKQYFGKLVSYADNKFAALNTAFWSGGSFIHVPKGVEVSEPMQAYFRMNYASMGQFERTLIIVDDEATAHYLEGCTAPTHSETSLHAAVVEIFVNKNAKFRYTTIQNWSGNVYNLVTKRAIAEENAVCEWVDGNIGSKITMKYPAIILKGDNSTGTTISVALAAEEQIQDAGSKMIHIGNNTKSNIISKSIAKRGGKANYRGLFEVKPGANNTRAKIECDTILLDDISTSDTLPTNIIKNDNTQLEHEATVSKISEEKLFYLMTRGIPKEQAEGMIVMGFIEPFTKELPMEYAVEMNRLMQFEVKGHQ